MSKSCQRCCLVPVEEDYQEEAPKKHVLKKWLRASSMQKVPELVVHERMSQGEKMKGIKEKKFKDGVLQWRK